MRVVAAVSGGVDSAVAAARLVEAGHDVTAVHLALSAHPQSHRTGARGCCTLEDAHDARRAADVLGIPFYVWDLAERFRDDVVEDFVAEYAAGRTPNPCLRCNEKIKFSAVLDKAVALGFDAVGTGHYARIVDGPEGRQLHRAVDPDKDQSYVLGVLTGEQLARAVFPLGGSTKSEVRDEAERRGLAVARKPDSHDVCFIPDGDTAGFLTRRLGAEPGPIVDADGVVLGQHDGAFSYTVGQRRGLRLGIPAADGKPRYVLDVSPVDRTVTVGSRADLAVDRAEGIRPRWCAAPAGGSAALHRAGAGARPTGAGHRPAPRRPPACPFRDARGGARGRPGRRPLRRRPGRRVCHGRPDSVGRGVTEQPWPDGSATGVGSMPGTDVREAMRVVVGELPDLPHLPELPGRGVGADLTGRTVGLLLDLHAEVQPSGWRFVDSAGRDERRAVALLGEDLDALEELAADWTGPLKLQVAGPWTMAATVELRYGDKALADVGACRDLAVSLAEGLAEHVRDVQRRVPGARLMVQLDEPAIPGVLAGTVPTASGFGRLRAVEPERLAAAVRTVFEALPDDVVRVVHCCAPGVPLELLVRAGAGVLSVDAHLLASRQDEALGTAVESGTQLLLGVLDPLDRARSAAL